MPTVVPPLPEERFLGSRQCNMGLYADKLDTLRPFR